jgi:hypothetical protein
MPGGDRTGPAGWGPMTGRGAGFCAGYPVAGFMNPAWGRGGRGRGWGRGAGGGGWGHRHGYFATGIPGWQRAWPTSYPPPATAPFAPFLTKEQELDLLRSQAKSFEQALDDLRRRIQEVESGPEGVAAT